MKILFQKKGSRGKRSINSEPTMTQQQQQQLESIENNAHEANLNEILRDSLYNFERNVRAPKGFYGLRGKKDFLGEEKRALLGMQQVK